jgi:hypothetical protein
LRDFVYKLAPKFLDDLIGNQAIPQEVEKVLPKGVWAVIMLPASSELLNRPRVADLA